MSKIQNSAEVLKILLMFKISICCLCCH